MMLSSLITLLSLVAALKAPSAPPAVSKVQKAILKKRNVAPTVNAKNLIEYGPHDRFQSHSVNLQFGQAYPFYFGEGNNGHKACQNFIFRAQVPVSIYLWDCFCAGDSFAAYDASNPLSILVRTNTDCDVNDPTCQYYLDDPLACAENGAFCQGETVLQPGFYNISIESLTSPYGAGTGFIWVDVYEDY